MGPPSSPCMSDLAAARAREGLCLAATLATAPAPEGSLPRRLAQAFALPVDAGSELETFKALLAALERRNPLLGLGAQHAERALAWAPAIFGGLAWTLQPELAKASRLALCHAAAERLWGAPSPLGPWRDAIASVPPLALGPIDLWPASLGSREALALREKSALGATLGLARPGRASRL